jgi:DNA-binding transcriptional LysR family regulator
VNLSTIDLNLLVALQALLAERSVTRAAQRTGRSQPAMSNALARLRSLLDDQILVRSGRSMVLSPRAEAMKGPLEAALNQVRATLTTGVPFDPAESTRTFRISAVDMVQASLSHKLAPVLALEAPGIAIEMRPPQPLAGVIAALDSRELDLGVGRYAGLPRSVARETLLEDRVVRLVRAGHPALRARKGRSRLDSISRIGTNPWIFMDRPEDPGPPPKSAGPLGPLRFSSDSPLVLPLVAAHSDLVCHAPERLVSWLIASLGLRVLSRDGRAPKVRVDLFWHRRSDGDMGITWLRQRIHEAFATESELP